MTRPYWLILGMLMVDSLHYVFARLLLPHISPAISAFYVMIVGTVEIGIWGIFTKKINFEILRKNLWFFLAIGFLVAASTNINYEAIAFIDPGTASLLSQAGVFFGMGFGMLWLKEKLISRQLIGAFIAIIGVLVISFQPGNYLRLGSFLVILSTLMYAAHTALTKRFADNLDFINFFFMRLLFTSSFLLIFSLLRNSFTLPSISVWPLLLLVGTTDIVISRTFYYLALRKLKLSIHTVVLTLSPAVAVIWSLFLFDIFPTEREIIGGTGILSGVLLATVIRGAEDKNLPDGNHM